tara:strand:- start:2248 stop:2532 length:285 start_codon:yes stop_codon:yes gene_type:complete
MPHKSYWLWNDDPMFTPFVEFIVNSYAGFIYGYDHRFEGWTKHEIYVPLPTGNPKQVVRLPALREHWIHLIDNSGYQQIFNETPPEVLYAKMKR